LAKPNAVQQLGTDLKLQQSHIAIISETWFSDQHTNDVLSIEGFTLYRRHRSKQIGGGVCAYVLNNIDCSVIPYNNCTDDIEIMWLKCAYNGNIYCIACCYHPPNPHYDHSLFVPSLIHGIDTFSSKYYNEYIIIAGDFNSLDCTALESQCGLVQLVNDPTHGNNILDKVFTNRFDLYSATVGKSLVKTKHTTQSLFQPLLLLIHLSLGVHVLRSMICLLIILISSDGVFHIVTGIRCLHLMMYSSYMIYFCLMFRCLLVNVSPLS